MPHKIKVFDSIDETIFTYVDVECVYDACMNMPAWDPAVGILDIEEYYAPEQTVRLKEVDYLVYKGSVRVELPQIYLHCDEHAVEQAFFANQVMV